jgi:hypothetical protein
MLFFLVDGSNMKKVLLDDIFYIKTGLVEQPDEELYWLDSNGNRIRVRTLRMGSFNASTKKIKSIEQLEKAERRLSEIRKLREGKMKPRKYKKIETLRLNGRLIDDDKLLDKDDYVINTRNLGEDAIINGYSLSKSLDENTLQKLGPLCISHHFIVLKPRKSMLNLHVPFLHMMLDIIVDKVLPDLAQTHGLIRTKQLKQLQIQIPLDYSLQEKLYSQYQKLEDRCNSASMELDKFKESFIFS